MTSFRLFSVTPAFGLALTLCLTIRGQEISSLPKGEVIPKVACQSDSTFSYALYLPTTFDASHPTPVLFAFSPAGQGQDPVRTFQRSAERLGWVVVGSNDSRNGALERSLKAQELLWEELRKRFKIDERHCFVTGFSGGARMAVEFARKHPRSVAGVAAFGAFTPPTPLRAEDLHKLRQTAFFLACGVEDFNHLELVEERTHLRQFKLQAWAERYPGDHHAPSDEVADRAATYLDASARKQPLPFLEERTHAAEVLEAAGEALQAKRLWEEISDHASGTLAQRASREVARLAKDPKVRSELEFERAYDQEQLQHGQSRTNGSWAESLTKLVRLSKDGNPQEQRLARMLLQEDFVILFSEGQQALERKDWKRALNMFNAAIAIRPDHAWSHALRACALTGLKETEQALESLRTAIRLGLNDPQWLKTSELLMDLRTCDEFNSLLASSSSTKHP